MCVDFTDLNKACPKDSFPLPRIDQLVDSTAGHKLLTFMDAFSGYNQIVMDENDQEEDLLSSPAGDSSATKRLSNGRTSANKHLKSSRRYLTKPPLLSPSKQGEELYLYLAVSPTALDGLIQWSIELSEFDIDYRPRTAIKAQALADFIAEFTSKDDEPTEDVEQASKWTVNIDGSSTKDSGGVGIVLRSPEGDIIKQAIRLQYPTTNNEAEYEALLVGLKTAKILGATELDIRSDSQLVVGQVNGDYEAKEGRMQQYLQLVRHQISRFREGGTLPDNRHEARRLKVRASRFLMLQGTLYKRGFSLPYLRCLAPDEANYVMREIHEGVCGNHSGARALQKKVVRAGYYWPTMQADANRFVQHCDKCQRFANLVHSPPEMLVPMTASWPFAQWGLDIMGPFPIGRRQLKFLVVAIDYFTKWVEAEPLATITEKNVQNFVWKAVICRFGIPRVLVSDNGKQFDNPRFRQFSQEVRHPQPLFISWPSTSQRTSRVRIPTGETPFRMTFGSEAVVPVEDRETAETRMKRYQEKMARHYNSRVKPRHLSVGDLVLWKVTLATKNPSEGKLGPNWEGPYKVIEIRRPGTYHLEDMDGRRLPHPWNAEHLRKYYP
uniref:Uncharacterized protein n=1 Tax=Fagus sylvatica TaxID=28930 RepID=A0A2N9HQX3_FAGSY